MIKERQRLLNALNVFSDAILIIASYVISYVLRFIILDGGAVAVGHNWLVLSGFLFMACAITLYSMLNVYLPMRNRTYMQQFGAIVKADLCAVVILGIFLFVFKRVDFSRWMIVFLFVTSTFLVSTKHYVLRVLLKSIRKNGHNQKHVLLIGSGKLAQQYFQSICDNAEFGYSIDGYISDFTNDELPNKLGGIKQAESLIERGSFDEVVIAMKNVGRLMSPDLRETARGGIAASPTARAIAKRLEE